jgi:hypothetical protein
VLIFTQFADTARYLVRESAPRRQLLKSKSPPGASADPYALACRFSPKSNNKSVSKSDEGASSHLYRRAFRRPEPARQQCGRQLRPAVGDHPADSARRPGVDRIGQRAEEIHCYSFLPAEGVERLINLACPHPAAPAGKRRSRGYRRSLFRGTTTPTPSATSTRRNPVSLDDSDDDVRSCFLRLADLETSDARQA